MAVPAPILELSGPGEAGCEGMLRASACSKPTERSERRDSECTALMLLFRCNSDKCLLQAKYEGKKHNRLSAVPCLEYCCPPVAAASQSRGREMHGAMPSALVKGTLCLIPCSAACTCLSQVLSAGQLVYCASIRQTTEVTMTPEASFSRAV